MSFCMIEYDHILYIIWYDRGALVVMVQCLVITSVFFHSRARMSQPCPGGLSLQEGHHRWGAGFLPRGSLAD